MAANRGVVLQYALASSGSLRVNEWGGIPHTCVKVHALFGGSISSISSISSGSSSAIKHPGAPTHRMLRGYVALSQLPRSNLLQCSLYSCSPRQQQHC